MQCRHHVFEDYGATLLVLVLGCNLLDCFTLICYVFVYRLGRLSYFKTSKKEPLIYS